MNSNSKDYSSVNKYFVLFGNCKAVKGNSRSLICDLQRKEYHYIPNSLFNILEELKNNFVSDFFINNAESKSTINEYMNWLLDMELGVLTDNVKLFPKISDQFKVPSKVTNCIIDISNKIPVEFYKILIKDLSEFNCKCIEFRLFENFDIDIVSKLLEYLSNSRINDVRIVCSKNDELLKYVEQNKRIKQIIFFNEHRNEVFQFQEILIIKSTENLSKQNCGIICSSQFSSTVEHFTESIHYNSCLNKKISVDSQGEIKNCPSMSESFGNIKETSLAEAIDHHEFKKYWNINKDMIHVCKDCEFRYICTDCRAYVEDPEDILSKPLKCGYNPYTAEWSEWSSNPLKQKTINFYGLCEMVDDTESKNSSTV